LFVAKVVGQYVAIDKVATYDILERASLPVPQTFVLQRASFDDKIERDALRNFLVNNKRVIVKPSNTDHGDGVSIGITSWEQLHAALEYALTNSYDADILVQQQVIGDEYRFLVLRGRVIAVANRQPPFVIGDGVKSVRELIEVKNSNPLRGDGHISPLTKISIDEVAHFLGDEKLNSVLAQDEKIELLKTSNLSRGGEAVDFTDIASSPLKDMAVYAARECLLGIAGVDIITTDISGDQGFIIEVNASPGLRMHQFPSIGKPRDVAAMIFDELERLGS